MLAYLALAKIYSARNEKTKAMENLQKVEDTMGSTIFRVKDFKNCTMLDNIRNEPGFAEYIKVAEARYRKEHDKVEKLLAREGILDAYSNSCLFFSFSHDNYCAFEQLVQKMEVMYKNRKKYTKNESFSLLN